MTLDEKIYFETIVQIFNDEFPDEGIIIPDRYKDTINNLNEYQSKNFILQLHRYILSKKELGANYLNSRLDKIVYSILLQMDVIR